MTMEIHIVGMPTTDAPLHPAEERQWSRQAQQWKRIETLSTLVFLKYLQTQIGGNIPKLVLNLKAQFISSHHPAPPLLAEGSSPAPTKGHGNASSASVGGEWTMRLV